MDDISTAILSLPLNHVGQLSGIILQVRQRENKPATFCGNVQAELQSVTPEDLRESRYSGSTEAEL